jgi:opacity protein-like surface antigen
MTPHRIGVLTVAAALTIAGRAHAQTAPAATPNPEDRGYVEAVAQSAFGNVTSQSYGVEAGGTVWRSAQQHDVQIYGEFGNIRDVATPEIGAAAQLVAGALSQVQSAAVTYSVKQPVTFFGGGVRYLVTLRQSSVRPYAIGGFGAAQVKNDVAFQLGGADAATALSQFVTIGSDLSGSQSKAMLTLGGGVVWPAWERLVVDFRYRYGRIFTDTPITVSRVGVGIGLRF